MWRFLKCWNIHEIRIQGSRKYTLLSVSVTKVFCFCANGYGIYCHELFLKRTLFAIWILNSTIVVVFLSNHLNTTCWNSFPNKESFDVETRRKGKRFPEIIASNDAVEVVWMEISTVNILLIIYNVRAAKWIQTYKIQ